MEEAIERLNIDDDSLSESALLFIQERYEAEFVEYLERHYGEVE